MVKKNDEYRPNEPMSMDGMTLKRHMKLLREQRQRLKEMGKKAW